MLITAVRLLYSGPKNPKKMERKPDAKPQRKQLPERQQIPYALSTQRHSLVTTGLLNMSKYKLVRDLEPIGTQVHLKVLNLTGLAGLESLATLPPQPDLRQIIADRTGIKSYAGLSRHPRLESLSLVDTPIAGSPNFVLTCLVLVGPRLTRVRGTSERDGLVSERLRREANMYPLIARFLIENGWEIEQPVPTQDRFRELAKERGLKIRGVDSEFSNDEAMRYLRPPPNLMRDSVAAEMFKTEIEERTVEQINSGDDLVKDVVKELRNLGINVKSDEEEVLKAMGALCDVVKKLKDVMDLGDGSDRDEEEEDEEAA